MDKTFLIHPKEQVLDSVVFWSLDIIIVEHLITNTYLYHINLHKQNVDKREMA